MENKTIEKVINMADSGMKLAANLSEAKKEKVIPVGDSDNSNNASTGSQNIQIHMDAGKKKDPKPVEKHIHEFPDNRPMTEAECELALKRAQMDYELKKSEQVYSQKAYDREWQHKLEVEKKNEKKGKIRRVVGSILVAIGAGAIGYGIYADYRDHKNQTAAPTPVPETDSSTITGEGDVK